MAGSHGNRCATALALACIFWWSGAARANGKFPEAGQIVVDPSDPNHIAVRTTFGLLVTREPRARWDVVCEQGIGYADYEPAIAMTADGAVSAGLTEGIARSSADGCDWSLMQGVPSFAADLTIAPWNTSLVAAVHLDVSTMVAGYYESDAGAPFAPVGVPLPAGFAPTSVELAASDPARIYVSGVHGDPAKGALARSIDRGASWTLLDIAGSDGAAPPFIGAVDPNDADVVYVRLFAAPGRLLRSDDGGTSWSEVLVTAGYLRALALSPDGTTIVAGGEDDGVLRAPTSSHAFEAVGTTAPLCFRWTPQGIYACGHKYLNDGFAVALSTDEGARFEPLAYFGCLGGPLRCADGQSAAVCAASWPDLAEQLGSCTAGAGGATGAGGAGGRGATPPPAPAAEPEAGCGCRAAAPEHLSEWAALLLAVALARRARRPRRLKD